MKKGDSALSVDFLVTSSRPISFWLRSYASVDVVSYSRVQASECHVKVKFGVQGLDLVMDATCSIVEALLISNCLIFSFITAFPSSNVHPGSGLGLKWGGVHMSRLG